MKPTSKPAKPALPSQANAKAGMARSMPGAMAKQMKPMMKPLKRK